MWLQLELLVFLAFFILSFNDVESRGLESVKPISRSIREAHHGGGKNKKHPPKRPPCPNRKKCPKPPNHNKPHPHPKRRLPPRKPIVLKHPPNQQVTVQIQTDKKTDVVNSNNVHYQTIINHYHWVPLEFFNITQPNSTTTPQSTTIIQHFEAQPVDQKMTTPQTPASNCNDVTNRLPCTGSASQQNTSININLNVAPPSVFYYHNGFPPPVAANNPDNRKNNTQNDAEPSSQPTENEQQREKSTTTTTKIVQTSIIPSIEAPSQGEPLTTTNSKPLEESTETTATKLTTTTVEPLKVPEGQKPDNEDEQLDITSTPDTGRKLPPKPPTQKTSSVANGAHVQNEPDVFGPSVAPT